MDAEVVAQQHSPDEAPGLPQDKPSLPKRGHALPARPRIKVEAEEQSFSTTADQPAKKVSGSSEVSKQTAKSGSASSSSSAAAAAVMPMLHLRPDSGKLYERLVKKHINFGQSSRLNAKLSLPCTFKSRLHKGKQDFYLKAREMMPCSRCRTLNEDRPFGAPNIPCVASPGKDTCLLCMLTGISAKQCKVTDVALQSKSQRSRKASKKESHVVHPTKQGEAFRSKGGPQVRAHDAPSTESSGERGSNDRNEHQDVVSRSLQKLSELSSLQKAQAAPNAIPASSSSSSLSAQRPFTTSTTETAKKYKDTSTPSERDTQVKSSKVSAHNGDVSIGESSTHHGAGKSPARAAPPNLSSTSSAVPADPMAAQGYHKAFASLGCEIERLQLQVDKERAYCKRQRDVADALSDENRALKRRIARIEDTLGGAFNALTTTMDIARAGR